jgi:hypothetical protein
MWLNNVAILSLYLKWLVTLPVPSAEGPWHECMTALACAAAGAAGVLASIGFGFALEALTRERAKASGHKETRG